MSTQNQFDHQDDGGNIVALPGTGRISQASLVADCRDEMEAAGLSIQQAAREIGRGVSSATLSKWLRDRYEGDVGAVSKRIETWIETRRERARRAIGGAGLDRHASLQVTADIEAVLGHAQAAADVVLVHGRSGAGKSWASRRYCGSRTAAHFVVATGAVTTLSGLLGRVADAVGGGARHVSALAAESVAVARLRDRGALLAVDEAHHLSARLLDELRCIRDMAGCGLALIGGDELWTRLASSPHCDQIVGRIGIRLPVGRVSETDVRELGGAVLGRETAARETRLLLASAQAAGGLHALRRLLVRAWIHAKAEGRATTVQAEDLTAAAEEGGAP